jgi:hypothetical protein
MKLYLNFRKSIKLGLKYTALCLVTYAVCNASTLYSFTATTSASSGSPSHIESFQLEVDNFLAVDSGLIPVLGSDPALRSCAACLDSSTVPALNFLRGSDSDLIQFADLDGTTRAYFFPLESLTSVGDYNTLPGVNVNVATLTVSQGSQPAVPEPSTFALLTTSLALIAVGIRRHRTQMRQRLSSTGEIALAGMQKFDVPCTS